MKVMYNDNSPEVVAWLRALIETGDLPDGDVYDEPISLLLPGLPWGYDQCHFFAGIGGWPLACELAGWDGPIWTASLPCQPFSHAGKQLGVDDHRHLWPVFHELVAEHLPSVIVGEQVASKAGREWLAAVRADLEALGYAVGAADLCAAGVGAPHIRQRLYWVAERMDNTDCRQRLRIEQSQDWRNIVEYGSNESWSDPVYVPCADGKWRPLPRRVADASSERRQQIARGALGDEAAHGRARWDRRESNRNHIASGNGEDRNEAARPTQPSPLALADGLSPLLVRGCGEGVPEDQIDPDATAEGRVMRLKGYGNAIVPELAAEFLKAVEDAQWQLQSRT
jgi:DNA (cytosine-5)-methyltransferase 1